MATQLGDTLTTREAVRRATLDDIVGRAEIAGTPMEGGPLDGIVVVTMGTLRGLVTEALNVDLPPATDKYAEVSTPANIEVDALCPECSQSVSITGRLYPRLVVENSITEISVKWAAKAVKHLHGQQRLPEDGQTTLEDVEIEDLRLRVLTAIADLEVEHEAEHEPGPPVSLDLIAQRLEIAGENDRGDLEESLYRWSQLEPALVEIRHAVDEPVTYWLTDEGTALVDAGRADVTTDDDDDEPDGDA